MPLPLRRTLLTALAAAPLLPAAVTQAAAAPDPYAAAVDAGLRYFRRRADDQLALLDRLIAALRTGDVARARAAYIQARPPYEEIEVLAPSFPREDSDIDARPYAFARGETDPEFRGFHRIEALLFRDDDAPAALPFAERLVRSVRSLAAALEQRQRFNATRSFAGCIALANEIAAKKISSEEETWSDQSLLIFRRNLVGIASQSAPFEPFLRAAGAGARWDALALATARAEAVVAELYGPRPVRAAPYSGVPVADRRRIARTAIELRDALIAAAGALGVAD